MTWIEIAAVLGALAWTPHIFAMARSWWQLAEVCVITQHVADVGFTTMGPIFNLRMAFAVTNQDLIVSNIRIRLIHDSGEEKIFEWQRITQQILKMTTPDSTVMPLEKEQSVLAIKLTEKDIEERKIWFQEVSFIAGQVDLIAKSHKKMSYLKAEGKFDAEEFLREQEMTDLYSFNKRAFSWKEGRYKARIELSALEKFRVVDAEREFYLTSLDIEELTKNIGLLETNYRNKAIGNDDEEESVVWQWRSPVLRKI